MARRVNTQFIFILGGGLFIGVAAIVGVLYYKYRLEHDPAHLLKQSAQAEASGNMALAQWYQSRAANESVKRHAPGTDQL